VPYNLSKCYQYIVVKKTILAAMLTNYNLFNKKNMNNICELLRLLVSIKKTVGRKKYEMIHVSSELLLH